MSDAEHTWPIFDAIVRHTGLARGWIDVLLAVLLVVVVVIAFMILAEGLRQRREVASRPMSQEINLDTLGEEYQYVDDDENVKAKVWEGEQETRLYIRTRRHDDRRKFDEFYVVL